MPLLSFPTDEVVGTLDWASAVLTHGSLVLATGDIEVPDGENLTLSLLHVESAEPTEHGWSMSVSREPLDVGFITDLPADSVHSLRLQGAVVPETAEALVHLAPGLRNLYITNAGLTDDILPCIGKLTGLTYLQTFGNAFTDAGVQQLVALQVLNHLYLEEESLTVAALDFVVHLPRLARLGLMDMPVTDEELAQLRSRLPGVRVG